MEQLAFRYRPAQGVGEDGRAEAAELKVRAPAPPPVWALWKETPHPRPHLPSYCLNCCVPSSAGT